MLLHYLYLDHNINSSNILLAESIKIYKSTTRQYLHLLDLLQKLPNPPIQPQLFTFAAFRWAVAVVMTRQNNIPIIENEGKNSHRTAVALIPVFDMPNHKAGEVEPIIFFFFNSKDSFCITCLSLVNF